MLNPRQALAQGSLGAIGCLALPFGSLVSGKTLLLDSPTPIDKTIFVDSGCKYLNELCGGGFRQDTKLLIVSHDVSCRDYYIYLKRFYRKTNTGISDIICYSGKPIPIHVTEYADIIIDTIYCYDCKWNDEKKYLYSKNITLIASVLKNNYGKIDDQRFELINIKRPYNDKKKIPYS